MTTPKPEIRLTQHLIETLQSEADAAMVPSDRWNRVFTAPVIRTLVGVAAAVVYCHAQRRDDRCWMDVAKVYEAAGLPPPDASVGDQAAMLENCKRYVEVHCTGGPWPSYRELEAEVAWLKSLVPPEPDTPLDLNKMDEYVDGKVPGQDVATCLRVLRTLRTVCVKDEAAAEAILLSTVHRGIFEIIENTLALETEEEKETHATDEDPDRGG